MKTEDMTSKKQWDNHIKRHKKEMGSEKGRERERETQ